MWDCVRLTRTIGLALALLLGPVPAALAAGAERVVSINLCTDQLAMMLARPGQLLSVSYLAQDPMSSVMVEKAGDYPTNRGLAEDVFILQPDVVVAGEWTTPATAEMLERLGVRVERFPLAKTPEEIAAVLRKMGAVLGQEGEADRQADAFLAAIARLREERSEVGRAALYGANGFTSGSDSLSTLILELAGFENITAELGRASSGYLSLEELVLADPDHIVRGRRFPGVSRSESVIDHPALAGLAPQSEANAGWVCGLPQILAAVEGLAP